MQLALKNDSLKRMAGVSGDVTGYVPGCAGRGMSVGAFG